MSDDFDPEFDQFVDQNLIKFSFVWRIIAKMFFFHFISFLLPDFRSCCLISFFSIERETKEKKVNKAKQKPFERSIPHETFTSFVSFL